MKGQPRTRHYASELIPRIVFQATAVLIVVTLISIFVFLLINGANALREISFRDFFLRAYWNPDSYIKPAWGILSFVVGTGLVSAVALLLVLILGPSIAIYLSEIAPPRLRELVKPLIEMIASIPSVVLGLLGLLFLAPLVATTFHLSNGLNALTAAILVAVATLPTVASICDDALNSVPHRYRESSLALGATKWTTIRRVVIPAAKPGILAAVMLGLGRIIGETMVVLMVAGNSVAFPRTLFDSVRPMTANIAIEIKEVVVGGLHWHALFAIGLVLFLITFVINGIADLFIHRRDYT